MYKILLLVILFFFNSFPQSLNSKLDKLLQDEFFNSCAISIQVEDLTADKILFKKNEKLLLRPASNMKIITSAAGLLYLGPDYEFITSLFYSGEIINNTLNGDLYIVGGCDPDLKTEDFNFFVDALTTLGVTKISGNIYADISFKDSLFWGKGWMWDDDPSFDAPYLSALNLNDNCVEVVAELDESSGKPLVKINPETKYVYIKNESLSEAEEKFQITRNWMNRENTVIVKGRYPASQNYVKQFVNVFEPEKYFIKVFSEVLDSSSIKFNGYFGVAKVPTDAKEIFAIKRRYSDIINNLNKTSDNLSAEMTLYALSNLYFGSSANADNGVKVINMLIDSLKLDSEDYRIVDGSGVSHYNVVSSELIVKLLKYFYEKYPELYLLLYNSFPIAGIDGTLEYRMRNTSTEKNVHAKTGTLTGVSCLSGYVTAKNNHQIAFSILMQNYVGSSKEARKFQDEICKILAEYN